MKKGLHFEDTIEHDDFYAPGAIEKQVEEDEISSIEAGFMAGYCDTDSDDNVEEA